MQTVQEIYEQYRIMPQLQLHQLRVAAVGKLVCESVHREITRENIVLAGLFHDMGNIIKFDLDYFPEFVEPERKRYWENVKKEYIEKYGTEHHTANVAIATEIGLPQAAIECIRTVGFAQVQSVLESESFEKKVCEYSDMRVGPHGVLPLEERILDGRKRYLNRASKGWGLSAPIDQFSKLVELEKELEKQIFAHARIKPEDITNEAIAGDVEKFRGYPLKVKS